MDVINCISKVPGYPNSEPVGLDGLAPASKYYANGPKVHDYIQEMNKEVLSKYDCMTVGEASDVDVVHAQRFTNPDNHELNMVFFFEHVCVGQPNNDKWKSRQWKLTELKEVFEMWQQRLHGVGWNSLFLSNHDQPRQVSRFGDDTKYRTKSAQMLGTMLHTLEGTPYIYQGEELGMTNVDFGCLEDYRDVEMFNKWEELKKTKEMDYDQFLKIVAYIGRDNSRTPMQWDDSQNGGFTTGNPWMKLNPNYTSINAKNEMSDPNSVFNYYKKLLKLRTEHLIMSYGEVKIILKESEEIFAYTKQLDDVMWLIILNFKGDNVEFTLPTDVKVTQQKILISNYEVDEKEDVKHFTLKPYEARVYHI
ncbi:Oligo-1 [Entamoeba marina]